MKAFGLAASIVALMSSGAIAADAYDKGSTKDSGIFSAPKTVNFTGFYIGGSLGYGNANHELSIHDYFKDFCAYDAQAADPNFNPFEGGVDAPAGFPGNGSSARQWTLGNVKANIPGVTGTNCDNASHPLLTNQPNPTPVTTVKGDSREIASIDGINSSGLVGDGRIGFDLQRGRFVGGIFASYGFNDMSTDVSFGGTTIKAIEKDDEWSVGARAGILVNERTLAYILAAYTESEFSFAGLASNGGNKEVTFSGLTVGGGVEFALTQNVFLGVEGTHTFYGEETILDLYDAKSNQGIRINDEIGETKVMGTLKIKLNTGLGGVID